MARASVWPRKRARGWLPAMARSKRTEATPMMYARRGCVMVPSWMASLRPDVADGWSANKLTDMRKVKVDAPSVEAVGGQQSDGQSSNVASGLAATDLVSWHPSRLGHGEWELQFQRIAIWAAVKISSAILSRQL